MAICRELVATRTLERGPLSVHALPLDATYVINVQIVPLRHRIARLPHGETCVLCGDEFRKHLHLQVFRQILHLGHLQLVGWGWRYYAGWGRADDVGGVSN